MNDALLVNNVDKYALATNLTLLANRVQVLENAGYATTTSVESALAAARSYADSLAGNYDTKGSADAALNAAKSYTDTQFANIQSLTNEEIENATLAAEMEEQGDV